MAALQKRYLDDEGEIVSTNELARQCWHNYDLLSAKYKKVRDFYRSNEFALSVENMNKTTLGVKDYNPDVVLFLIGNNMKTAHPIIDLLDTLEEKIDYFQILEKSKEIEESWVFDRTIGNTLTSSGTHHTCIDLISQALDYYYKVAFKLLNFSYFESSYLKYEEDWKDSTTLQSSDIFTNSSLGNVRTRDDVIKVQFMNVKIKKFHTIDHVHLSLATALEIEEAMFSKGAIQIDNAVGVHISKLVSQASINVQNGTIFSIKKALLNDARIAVSCDLIHLEDVCAADCMVELYPKKVRFRGFVKGIVEPFFFNCLSLDNFADLESFKVAILELLDGVLPAKRKNAILASSTLPEACKVIVSSQTVARHLERRCSWTLYTQILEKGESHT